MYGVGASGADAAADVADPMPPSAASATHMRIPSRARLTAITETVLERSVKDRLVREEREEQRQQAPGHRPAQRADEAALPPAGGEHVREDPHQQHRVDDDRDGV